MSKDPLSRLLASVVVSAVMDMPDNPKFEPCDRPDCGFCSLMRAKRAAATAARQAAQDAKPEAAPSQAELERADLARGAEALVNLREGEPGPMGDIKRAAAALVLEIKKVRERSPVGGHAWIKTDVALEHALAASNWAVRAVAP
ncbi:hypothetical protein H4CHR_04429 [Variovorax sp. PBS-H4]|uniref:hypothetical protein n=1 Tax=Variovorax sp. PBS-H4 TaxID=434008 RepID=UPI001317DB26|nr:hypothetical protein [Variovorax sp. PBS-H4]VTU38455.1 hypothetical protein H4CHR_04429 [Variovorax sp. PBS-H4]